MTLSLDEVIARIDSILNGYRFATTNLASNALPSPVRRGKLYEAWTLSTLIDAFGRRGLGVKRPSSSIMDLKTFGGPIDRRYPHFDVTSSRGQTWELWTDIYFLTLSHALRGNPCQYIRSDFHELDIVAVRPGTAGMPRHDEIAFAVSCKDTRFKKVVLRETLGFRFELGFHPGIVSRPLPHPLLSPPKVSAGRLYAYSTDRAVLDFQQTGNVLGIRFAHLGWPWSV